MKRNILFKTLIDILFIIHCLGAMAFVFMAPVGIIGINISKIEVNEWQFVHWFILCTSFVSYVIFLIALFYLKKAARLILNNNFFSTKVAKYLRKSGRYFLAVSILIFLMFVSSWINKFAYGKLEFIYNSNAVVMLLLAVIGLFFIIQSEVLVTAKQFKEENDLTI